jgi:hypothetical protein
MRVDPIQPFRDELDAAGDALKNYDGVDWKAGKNPFQPKVLPNFNEAKFGRLIERFKRAHEAKRIAESDSVEAALLWKLSQT